jgi:hypothetical protein
MRATLPFAAIALALRGAIAVAAPVGGTDFRIEIANSDARVEAQTLAKAQATVEAELSSVLDRLQRREAERVVAAAPSFAGPSPVPSGG